MMISSLISPAVFYVFSMLLVAASVAVITSRNPVRGVLFLVLCFFSSAVLWMLLEAEFLALILIVVYVGAVMTLFLFVVMMLDINVVPKQQGFVKYLPVGLIIMAVLLGVLIIGLLPKHLGFENVAPEAAKPTYNNIVELGQVLYTNYIYSFELAGVLLLVAIVAAISLAFRGRRSDTKAQKIAEQLAARSKDRVRIVKMQAEKKQ